MCGEDALIRDVVEPAFKTERLENYSKMHPGNVIPALIAFNVSKDSYVHFLSFLDSHINNNQKNIQNVEPENLSVGAIIPKKIAEKVVNDAFDDLGNPLTCNVLYGSKDLNEEFSDFAERSYGNFKVFSEIEGNLYNQ